MCGLFEGAVYSRARSIRRARTIRGNTVYLYIYNNIILHTSRMQALGERRRVLHRRPRMCMCQFIEPVTFARCAFIFVRNT